MLRLLSLAWVLIVSASALTTHSKPQPHDTTSSYFIPFVVQNVSAQAQFTSGVLDGPKVHPINSSVWDWWYFDAVTLDATSRASVVVTFFTTPQTAFPLLPPSDYVTVAYIWVSWPNGTLWSWVMDADGATVIVNEGGGGASGTWHGTGFSFTSTPELEYKIEIDSPGAGVVGSISFQPTSPPHYPCGPVAPGQTVLLSTHLGWENAIPDAVTVVDLRVRGERLAFTGSGYHDKNWSDQPFGTHVYSWYWGRGRLGPYSLVWWDIFTVAGTESLSAYIARDGNILTASCAPGSVLARPTGNTTYPPVLSGPNPTGYHVEFDLGEEGKLVLDVDVWANLVEENPEYGRFVGGMEGLVVDAKGVKGEKLTGTALFEQFKLRD
ncbi:hypothetical protein C8R45DRAFT_844101 [Mycena sanguinolenta]|nr:hypothetical protein C8R45DRAFT_844101 [Mycena sanguinolenta]